jgi:hypothetical protein
MRIHLIGLLCALWLASTAAACTRDGSSAGADASIDGGSVMPDASPMHGADAPTYEYDQHGCLTFASASRVCGVNSDDSVCALRVSCQGGDDGQCKIDCEMGSTVSCYKMADVQCLLNAVAAHDCAMLAACGWII